MGIPHLRRRAAMPAALLVLCLALPAAVLADAELAASEPADGTTVESPTTIVQTFTAALDAERSSLVLVTGGGTELATGGVDPTDDRVMRIDPMPALGPGTYVLRWTAGATDGHLTRGTVTFTVVAPPPTPAPTATPAPSATASPRPSPAPSASPSASPTAAPPSSGDTGSLGGDVLLPILAVLAVVAILGVRLLRGRGATG